MGAGAARIRAKFLTVKNYWRDGLVDLNRGAAHTTRVRRRRQAILGRPRPSTAVGHCRDGKKLAVVCRTISRPPHSDVPKAGSALRRHALGRGLGEAAERDVWQHLANNVARANRCRIGRVQD